MEEFVGLTVMCPMCNRTPMLHLGTLGDHEWYRCEGCHAEKCIDNNED